MPDDSKLPPPSGDAQRAEGYVSQLITLISDSKLKVSHTDLSKYDPSSLHDHYSLDLQEYQIEISHSKQPTTGRDSYVILFNNLKNIAKDQTQKEILAYLVIDEGQFKKLKDVADEQIETLKKIEEEKRFKTAMTPVDALIDKITKGEVDVSKSPQPVPELPTEEQKIEEPAIKEAAEPTPPEEVAQPIAVEPRGGPQDAPSQEEQKPIADTPKKPISALETAAAIPIVEETPNPLSTTRQHVAAEPEEPAPIVAPSTPPPTTEALPTWPDIPQPVVELTPATQPPPPPLLDETSAQQVNGSSPLPAPTATIEQVQQALKKAYEQTPQQPAPQEYRPDIAHVQEHTNLTSAPLGSTINTIPTENNPTTNPPIDQAIDQAFKPANNLTLTHDSKTPDV